MSHLNIIRITNNLCQFSPDGTLFATCFQNKLTIRKTTTFDQCQTFSCFDLIAYIEWSPDNQYILCALYQHSTVQVFSLLSPDWKCRLRDTECGIVRVCWSPDSRHILTTAEFHVSICIWSLVSHSVKYIECVKEISNPSLSFSADGYWLAVVGDRGTFDCVSIYSTSWQLIKQISCTGLGRLQGISWACDSKALCVWEDSPDKCQIQVYEVPSGDLLGKCFPPSRGRIYGVKTTAWIPSGQFFALGCFDDKVWLLNHITWQPMVELPHSDVLLNSDCTIHQESAVNMQPNKVSFQIVSERPIIISSLQFNPEKPADLLGIGLIAFSSCGHLLATRADRMPAAVWIWSIDHLKLVCLIVHKQPVTAIDWNPVEPRLAIASGSGFVSLWSSHGMRVHMVDQLCISDVKWHSTGRILTLYASSKVALLLLPVL